MNLQWIECGLLWSSVDLSTAPPKPDLTSKLRKQFPDCKTRGMCKSIEEKKAYVDELHQWWKQQPEVIEWRRRYIKWHSHVYMKSFTGQGLNKPGTLIVIDTPEGEKTLLIGDINPSARRFNGIFAFPTTTVIKRYAVIDLGLQNIDEI
jgi:hypothetical protein